MCFRILLFVISVAAVPAMAEQIVTSDPIPSYTEAIPTASAGVAGIPDLGKKDLAILPTYLEKHSYPVMKGFESTACKLSQENGAVTFQSVQKQVAYPMQLPAKLPLKIGMKNRSKMYGMDYQETYDGANYRVEYATSGYNNPIKSTIEVKTDPEMKHVIEIKYQWFQQVKGTWKQGGILLCKPVPVS